MLLAVATPMHMMAPVSARNRKRGSGRKQHPDDAGQGGRQRHDDDERSAQDWKLTTIKR